MRIDEFAELADGLVGVRRTESGGLSQWRYRGRMVARQTDGSHVALRTDFDYRDAIVRDFPATFSVPSRLGKHMTVLADLGAGDADAIEGALLASWNLQRTSGP